MAAPKDVEMLCEEVGHALLDSDRCNIWRTDSAKVAYEDRPEEREAKLASLLAVLGAGLPLETQDGRLIPPRAARLDVAALERGENPRILLRARWAADIMVRAMRGDVAGAVAASGACPMSA